jgi:hypothetical protein
MPRDGFWGRVRAFPCALRVAVITRRYAGLPVPEREEVLRRLGRLLECRSARKFVVLTGLADHDVAFHAKQLITDEYEWLDLLAPLARDSSFSVDHRVEAVWALLHCAGRDAPGRAALEELCRDPEERVAEAAKFVLDCAMCPPIG